MYQYKAVLQHNREIIGEGHTLEDLEKQVLHYRREQKRGIHTNMNNPVELIHVKRDTVHGEGTDELIKVI